ncbi:MAG: hypothetical protein K0V04_03670 [Deltaproteobacteria bacterium]|nr:hypothetical protein [Deltaproteobacteria bacterium]
MTTMGCWPWVPVLVAVLATGCGVAERAPASAGDSTASGSSSTAATVSDSTAGPADSTAAPEQGMPSCDAHVCDEGEFYDDPIDSCCALDIAGSCRPHHVPPCSDGDLPVCGCDGQVYGSECAAYQAGVDLARFGSCQAPEGRFACGPWFCDRQADYCEITTTRLEDTLPSAYACRQPSQPCASGSVTCECLAKEPCTALGCGALPEGGTVLYCNPR